MDTLKFEDLQVGMFVVVSKAGEKVVGLVGRLCKVMVIDDPHMALEIGRHPAITKHIVNARESEFMKPSEDLIAALLPEESWPETVG